jgi:catechol 2,3-dioxygenase-like lactoylglutathione lyase family enzyme
MSSTTAADIAVAKVHTSLNVTDLAKSVEFYRALFDLEPAKHHRDYAKFEVTEPPLILSLIPGRPAPGGTLNHTGLRLTSSEELVKVQVRLEAAGIRTQREDGVECCYAKQTKFWVTDPDRTLWELYIFHEDTDDHGDGSAPDAEQVASFAKDVPNERVVWTHRLAEVVPARIPHADDSVHEVMLSGAANRSADDASLRALLAEAFRVLRPGGEVRVHGLAADRALTVELPPLPGPACHVQHVPARAEVVRALQTAGFVGLQCEKLSERAYFNVGGVLLRELLVAGRKPGFRPSKQAHAAIYLGPLAQATDDFGNVFPRGEAVSVNIHDWLALKNGAAASQFVLLPPDGGAPAS